MKSYRYFVFRVPFLTSSFLLFLGFLFFFSAIACAEMLSIGGNGVHLRTGPGKEYSIICDYGSGFPVQVVDKEGNWLKVIDFEKDTGWVHKSLLIDSLQVIVNAFKDKDEKINIRNGPDSDEKIVGKAYYGVVFKVLRQQSGWVEVEHESGLTGWVSSSLLWGI